MTTKPPYSHSPHSISRKYRITSTLRPSREPNDSDHSTTADVKDYLKSYMMPRASDKEIDSLLMHYPNDQRAGAPFDTGLKNVFSKLCCLSNARVRSSICATRSAVQTHFSTSRRFRFPWPASVVIELQGQQTTIMGVPYVS